MKVSSKVSIVNKKSFDERIKKVNSTNGRTVWECIDRPMRPLIFEMSRIGMIPKFSCCGYTYIDEEEPKTHHGSKAYVFFFAPEKYYDQFIRLISLVNKSPEWSYRYFRGGVWEIYANNSVPDNMYKKEDGIEESIHQYEAYAIAIDCLTVMIQDNFITSVDPVTIYDGNSFYTGCPNWMVKPKKNFVIGVDEYYETYGRYDFKEFKKTSDERVGMSLLTPEKIKEIQSHEVKEEV